MNLEKETNSTRDTGQMFIAELFMLFKVHLENAMLNLIVFTWISNYVEKVAAFIL